MHEFAKFAVGKSAFRTHCLDVGDYVISASPVGKEELHIEKIAELGYAGENDFRTVRGTTGPISGCIFIKLRDKRKIIMTPALIEGDSPYTGPGSVYRAVNQWVKRTYSNLN